jgi:F420-dependent oxidoreductase-like protein
MALIRRGIHLDTHGADDGAAVFGRLAEAARAAEDAGFDAISVPDHVYDPGGPAFPMFEAYTVLGALAAVTTSATLLTLASPVTFRAPGLLAKAVTTLDVVSGGRAVLSVGAGWDAVEHEAYGIDFPGVGERFDRLEEELAICRALFTGEQATFTGEFYAVRDAYNSPRPVRGSIPVLVAGNGEQRTLALVARYADACNLFAGPAEIRRKLDLLDRHCERAGRDPAEITRTVTEFAPDLGTLASSARALAAAGADGMIVACPDDPVRIAAIGQILQESFPG